MNIANGIRSIVFLLVSLILCNQVKADEVSAKIAIVGETDKYRNEVSLLTAELSAMQGIATLERAEIDTILKEHRLTGNSNNGLHIGKLLGADGLLILKSISIDKKPFLSTRLVAVHPGTIIDVFVFPVGKEVDPLGWTKTVQWHFAPLFKKLHVQRKDARPLSLLSIRAQTDRPTELVLERQINTLLSHRLMREKEVFVNERWDLGKALFEKELETQVKNDFWTGSAMVDGTFELKDGKISVSVKLSTKHSSKPLTIHVSGTQDNISPLIEALTIKIMKTVKGNALQAWDVKEESAAYEREAQWAYNCGLYKTARDAADAAWALGDTSTDLMMLRIKAYGGKEMQRHAYRQGQLTYHLSGKPVSKPEAYIDNFSYAMQLFLETCRKSPGLQRKLGLDGPGLLRFTSAILHSAYQKGLHQQERYRDNLVSLRDHAAILFEKVISEPASYDQRNYCYNLFIHYAPYWFKDTQTLVLKYKKYLTDSNRHTGILMDTRFIYKYREKAKLPWIVNWDHATATEKDSLVWYGFIRELLKSDLLRKQIDGIILRRFNPLARKDIKLPYAFANEVLWKHREMLVSGDKHLLMGLLPSMGLFK